MWGVKIAEQILQSLAVTANRYGLPPQMARPNDGTTLLMN